jgi:hypothetical protein
MTIEKPLSEKGIELMPDRLDYNTAYYEEDVKEAVEKLKEELSGWNLQRGMSDSKCHEIIDKIFGEFK